MSERVKRTYELDKDLIQLIRVQAAIEDISINDYINNVLWSSIPKDIKNIVK